VFELWPCPILFFFSHPLSFPLFPCEWKREKKLSGARLGPFVFLPPLQEKGGSPFFLGVESWLLFRPFLSFSGKVFFFFPSCRWRFLLCDFSLLLREHIRFFPISFWFLSSVHSGPFPLSCVEELSPLEKIPLSETPSRADVMFGSSSPLAPFRLLPLFLKDYRC